MLVNSDSVQWNAVHATAQVLMSAWYGTAKLKMHIPVARLSKKSINT